MYVQRCILKVFLIRRKFFKKLVDQIPLKKFINDLMVEVTINNDKNLKIVLLIIFQIFNSELSIYNESQSTNIKIKIISI